MKENSVAIAIRTAYLKIEKIGNQLLEPYDITHSQFLILLFFHKNPHGTVRQIDIEKYFSLTNPTITGILNKLEKKGWIERIKNPEDSRSKIICLTEKAYSMKEEILNIEPDLEGIISRNLNQEEHRMLLELLKKCVIN